LEVPEVLLESPGYMIVFPMKQECDELALRHKVSGNVGPIDTMAITKLAIYFFVCLSLKIDFILCLRLKEKGIDSKSGRCMYICIQNVWS
jgi:hypothetical protein